MRRPRRRRRRGRLLLAGLTVAAGCSGEPGGRAAPSAAPDGVLVVAYDGPDRVVATEHAQGDPDLELTSGSLLVRDGAAWTGPADSGAPEPGSGTTHSAVFRARTRRDDLGDVRIDLDVRNEGLTDSGAVPARAFDGISLGVRYRSPDDLYYVNVHRRDGTVAVKRKLDGRYTTLGVAPRAVPEGEWEHVRVEVRTVDGAVRIRLTIDGDVVLEVTDDERPLLEPGRVLLRGDNCQFAFDDLRVTPLPASP